MAGFDLKYPPGFQFTQGVAVAAAIAGIGLAPVGLILTLTGVILTVVESRRLIDVNPELARQPELLTKGTARTISRQSAVIFALAATAAYVAVSETDQRLWVLIPAVIAGGVEILFNLRLKRALAKG